MDIKIIDGDTVQIDGKSVRLGGADTRETKDNNHERRTHSQGIAAAAYLDNNAASVDVSAEQDIYNRSIGRVKDKDGRDVSERMVRQGLAAPTDKSTQAAFKDFMLYGPEAEQDPRNAELVRLGRETAADNRDLSTLPNFDVNDRRSMPARAWDRGGDNFVSSLYSFADVATGAIGMEDFAEDMRVKAKYFQDRGQLIPADMASLQTVADRGWQAKDIATFAAERLFEEAPSLLLDAAMAATGAGVGAAVARHAALKVATTRLGPAAVHQARVQKVIDNAAKAGAKTGGASAFVASVYPQSVGQVQQELERNGIEGNDWATLAAGGVVAAVQAAPELIMAAKIIGKAGSKGDLATLAGTLKQTGINTVVGATSEATAEVGAAVISKAVVKAYDDAYEIFSEGNLWEFADAAAAGGVIGGGLGGAGTLAGGAYSGLDSQYIAAKNAPPANQPPAPPANQPPANQPPAPPANQPPAPPANQPPAPPANQPPAPPANQPPAPPANQPPAPPANQPPAPPISLDDVLAAGPESAAAILNPEQTVTPETEQTVTPETEQTVTPETEQTVTPETEQTVTPETEQTVTPETEQTVTPEPEQTVTPEPEQTVTPEPAKQQQRAQETVNKAFENVGVDTTGRTRQFGAGLIDASEEYRTSGLQLYEKLARHLRNEGVEVSDSPDPFSPDFSETIERMAAQAKATRSKKNKNENQIPYKEISRMLKEAAIRPIKQGGEIVPMLYAVSKWVGLPNEKAKAIAPKYEAFRRTFPVALDADPVKGFKQLASRVENGGGKFTLTDQQGEAIEAIANALFIPTETIRETSKLQRRREAPIASDKTLDKQNTRITAGPTTERAIGPKEKSVKAKRKAAADAAKAASNRAVERQGRIRTLFESTPNDVIAGVMPFVVSNAEMNVDTEVTAATTDDYGDIENPAGSLGGMAVIDSDGEATAIADISSKELTPEAKMIQRENKRGKRRESLDRIITAHENNEITPETMEFVDNYLIAKGLSPFKIGGMSDIRKVYTVARDIAVDYDEATAYTENDDRTYIDTVSQTAYQAMRWFADTFNNGQPGPDVGRFAEVLKERVMRSLKAQRVDLPEGHFLNDIDGVASNYVPGTEGNTDSRMVPAFYRFTESRASSLNYAQKRVATAYQLPGMATLLETPQAADLIAARDFEGLLNFLIENEIIPLDNRFAKFMQDSVDFNAINRTKSVMQHVYGVRTFFSPAVNKRERDAGDITRTVIKADGTKTKSVADPKKAQDTVAYNPPANESIEVRAYITAPVTEGNPTGTAPLFGQLHLAGLVGNALDGMGDTGSVSFKIMEVVNDAISDLINTDVRTHAASFDVSPIVPDSTIVYRDPVNGRTWTWGEVRKDVAKRSNRVSQSTVEEGVHRIELQNRKVAAMAKLEEYLITMYDSLIDKDTFELTPFGEEVAVRAGRYDRTRVGMARSRTNIKRQVANLSTLTYGKDDRHFDVDDSYADYVERELRATGLLDSFTQRSERPENARLQDFVAQVNAERELAAKERSEAKFSGNREYTDFTKTSSYVNFDFIDMVIYQMNDLDSGRFGDMSIGDIKANYREVVEARSSMAEMEFTEDFISRLDDLLARVDMTSYDDTDDLQGDNGEAGPRKRVDVDVSIERSKRANEYRRKQEALKADGKNKTSYSDPRWVRRRGAEVAPDAVKDTSLSAYAMESQAAKVYSTYLALLKSDPSPTNAKVASDALRELTNKMIDSAKREDAARSAKKTAPASKTAPKRTQQITPVKDLITQIEQLQKDLEARFAKSAEVKKARQDKANAAKVAERTKYKLPKRTVDGKSTRVNVDTRDIVANSGLRDHVKRQRLESLEQRAADTSGKRPYVSPLEQADRLNQNLRPAYDKYAMLLNSGGSPEDIVRSTADLMKSHFAFGDDISLEITFNSDRETSIRPTEDGGYIINLQPVENNPDSIMTAVVSLAHELAHLVVTDEMDNLSPKQYEVAMLEYAAHIEQFGYNPEYDLTEFMADRVATRLLKQSSRVNSTIVAASENKTIFNDIVRGIAARILQAFGGVRDLLAKAFPGRAFGPLSKDMTSVAVHLLKQRPYISDIRYFNGTPKAAIPLVKRATRALFNNPAANLAKPIGRRLQNVDRDLARKFYTPPGDKSAGKTAGLMDESVHRRKDFVARATLVFGSHKAFKLDYQKFIDTGKASAKLDSVFEYMADALAGVRGEQSNYAGVPVMFNHNDVATRLAEFRKILIGNSTNKYFIDLVDDFIKGFDYSGLTYSELDIKPANVFSKSDVFARIRGQNPGVVLALKSAGFIHPGTVETLNQFAGGMANRVEFERLFGAKDFSDKGTPIWNPSKKLSDSLAAIPDGPNRKEAIRAIHSMLGFDAMRVRPSVRTASDWAVSLTSLAVLPLSGFASVPDLMTPFLRERTWTGAVTGMARTLGMFVTNPKRAKGIIDAYSLANSAIHDTVWSHMMAENAFLSKAPRVMSNMLFKLNGLELITKISRNLSAVLAIDSIVKHANNPSRASADFLNEIGITRQQAFAIKQYLDMNDTVPVFDPNGTPEHNALAEAASRAVTMYTNESVVQPNRAQLPAIMNDPNYRVFTFLKPFLYGFGAVIYGGNYREMRKRFTSHTDLGSALLSSPTAMMPLILAFGMMMPMAAMALELREWLKDMIAGNDTYSKRLDALSDADYAAKMFSRSGGAAFLEIPMSVYDGWERGYNDKWAGAANAAVVAAGPVVSVAAQAGQDVAKVSNGKRDGVRLGMWDIPMP